MRSSTSQTNVTGTNQTTTTVNKDEFRSRHTEVFSLGRHPKSSSFNDTARAISD